MHPDWGFPGGSVVKNLTANAGDEGSIPRSGRFPLAGNGNPLQCSCLGNLMDRGAWWGCKRVGHELVTKQQQQQQKWKCGECLCHVSSITKIYIFCMLSEI